MKKDASFYHPGNLLLKLVQQNGITLPDNENVKQFIDCKIDIDQIGVELLETISGVNKQVWLNRQLIYDILMGKKTLQ